MIPIIIIGAPRSGTNMLRDLIVKIPGCGTWPCDEIPFIWRHGNLTFPNDEFPSDLANERASTYIRNQFEKLCAKQNHEYIIEKTCANSLRVAFIEQILPEAKYIFIVRNGVDAISSAMKRWQAEFEFKYTLRKMRYVPISDYPYHIIKYIKNRLYKMFNKKNQLYTWGPITKNTQMMLGECSLEEICADQWRECVEKTDAALKKINNNRIHFVKYEDFVRDTKNEYKKLVEYLGVKEVSDLNENNFNHITTKNIGKGYKKLGDNQIKRIFPVIESTLKKYGYI